MIFINICGDKGGIVQRDDSLIILRIALGVIFFAHGAQKLLGWFGGPGFAGAIQLFQQRLAIPPYLTVIVIFVEFFGGLFLLLGLLTRLAAAFIAVDMAVALVKVHLPQGFFVVAGGKVGIEFVLVLLMMALYLAINGGGGLSLDRLLRARVGGRLARLLG